MPTITDRRPVLTEAAQEEMDRWWKKRRRRYVKSHGNTCQACRRRNPKNHLHHMTYATYGAEPDEHLVMLCSRCHGTVHSLDQSYRGLTLQQVTVLVIEGTRRKRKPGEKIITRGDEWKDLQNRTEEWYVMPPPLPSASKQKRDRKHKRKARTEKRTPRTYPRKGDDLRSDWAQSRYW